MNHPLDPVLFAAELSDEAAYQIRDFLQVLATEFETFGSSLQGLGLSLSSVLFLCFPPF